MSKKKTNPMAKVLMLLVIVGTPALFILVSMGTSWLMDVAPYAIVVVAILLTAVYSAMTARLLYTYFESRTPFYAYIPMYGELALIDSKYMRVGTLFYALIVLIGAASFIPASLLGNSDFAMNIPYYFKNVCLILLCVVQVIKGIGLVACTKVIASEWDDKVHGTLGSIQALSYLGFIPFVRAIAIYALNKPLSTLVTFNGISVSDNTDVELEEDE